MTLAEIGQWLMVTQIRVGLLITQAYRTVETCKKQIIKEFYTKERKLSLYTPIEDINVLIKWYIGSDVA